MSEENSKDGLSSSHIKIRIESLSDLVFGLALSIGSLELLARTPQNELDLATGIGLFAFSFIIVVSIWIGHARVMAVLPKETSWALSLNLILLFCVVLEPYLFFILQSNPPTLSIIEWASFGFALDVGAMFLILGSLIRLALREKGRGLTSESLSRSPKLARRFQLAMRFYVVIGVIYLISALPVFWIETPLGIFRFVFWYTAFAFGFLGILNRRRERTGKSV